MFKPGDKVRFRFRKKCGGREVCEVIQVLTRNIYDCPLPEPVAEVKHENGTSRTWPVSWLVPADTPQYREIVLSETIIHCRYSAGGTSYATETEARATGLSVKKCEHIRLVIQGRSKPKHKTRVTPLD